MFKLFNYFVGALAITLVMSLTAQAKVNYAGSDCDKRSGGTLFYDFDGAVHNNSTTSRMLVLCHVPHTDFDGILNAGEIDNGWVHAVDLNNGADLKCRFRRQSINANGSISRAATPLRSTTGFGTHRQVLNLNSLSENSISSYVLACDIPPRTTNGSSKVVVYSVSQ